MPAVFDLSVCLLSFFLFSPAALAANKDPNWKSLGDMSGVKECSGEKPCRLIEPNGTFEIKLDVKENLSNRQLKNLEIRDLKTGKTASFKLNEVNNHKSGELFEIYAVKLRGGAPIDLAVYAYDSAREGEAYYYFIYDQNNRNFIFSDGTYPKLVYSPTEKVFRTSLQGHKYALDQNFKFSPTH